MTKLINHYLTSYILIIYRLYMSEASKFQFKKITQFIIREETTVKALSAFFKSMEDYEKKNLDTIIEISRDLQDATSKLPNKQIAKHINNFSIHQSERSQAEANLTLITDRLNFWLEGGLSKLKELQEKAKRMQSNKHGLTPKDIDDFKAELTEEVLQLNRLKESILSLYCHTMIKNSSMQVEELTSKMQTELERRNLPISNMLSKKA